MGRRCACKCQHFHTGPSIPLKIRVLAGLSDDRLRTPHIRWATQESLLRPHLVRSRKYPPLPLVSSASVQLAYVRISTATTNPIIFAFIAEPLSWTGSASLAIMAVYGDRSHLNHATP